MSQRGYLTRSEQAEVRSRDDRLGHWRRKWAREVARQRAERVRVSPMPHVANRHCPGSVAFGFFGFVGKRS